MTGSTFSESWHRISGAKVGLLPTVEVHKQDFRNEPWYVLKDTYSQRFYRISPAAYAFIARLRPDRTVHEAWEECLNAHPDSTPGQEDVVQLLAQLHQANMLYFRSHPDSASIFKRYRSQKQKEFRGKLLSFLYIRIPLWDPDDWLNTQKPLIRLLTSPFMGFLWLIIVLTGATAVFQSLDALRDQTQGFLSMGNLPWLYLCMIFLKIAHEFSHAFMCKRFGGEVHSLGLMFLVFMPLPYVDATATWGFRERKKRALTGAAGMIAEVFLAALAALIWRYTGTGLLNSLAFNVMLIGSVSSLLFNGNPLLRFDAYYILSDLVDIPNLYQKANQQWLHFADKYLLGTQLSESPAQDSHDWWWMTLYGFLSFFYRFIIMMGILLYISSQWFMLGVVFALVSVYIWLLVPIKKLCSHLISPGLYRNRKRAILVTLCIAVSLSGFILFLPLPHSLKAPGVLEAEQVSTLHVSSEGELEALFPKNGTWVEKGDLLAVFHNQELLYQMRIAQGQIAETRISLRQAAHKSPADLAPLQRRLEVLINHMEELRRRQLLLSIRAPHPGYWIMEAPLHERLGTWFTRGETLGQIIDTRSYHFTAVVQQHQASILFQESPGTSHVRLRGQAHHSLQLLEFSLIPYYRQKLASPVLGWAGGGDIAIRQDQKGEEMAAEGFYEFKAAVLPPSDPESAASIRLLHGLSGKLRIPLKPEPLFWQIKRRVQQELQKRYTL